MCVIFVIPGSDGVDRPNACWNVAVDMKPQLVRLADARGQPCGVEGAVELDPEKPLAFALSTSATPRPRWWRRWPLARYTVPFRADERRWIDVRRQERARSRSAPALDRAHVVVAGSRTDVTPIDSSCKPVKSSLTCMWQSHKPGIKVLPAAVDHVSQGGPIDTTAWFLEALLASRQVARPPAGGKARAAS